MRKGILVVALLLSPLFSPTPALAQVSIQIGLPGINIGINQPVYPQLVAVPGYPVYYDPGASSNYFFYDGMYWVFQGDNWYASSWYNGPWALVAPHYVPVFILRVPVAYYRHPPAYFRGWQRDGPPRWGEHWGHDWERQRGGWDRWDRSSAPPPAPLPVYQKQYTGNRYPHAEQQRELRNQNYRYQPNDAEVRRVEQAHVENRAPPQNQQNQQKQQQAQQEQRQQQEKNQQKQQNQQNQQNQQKQQQAQQEQRQQQEKNQQKQQQGQQNQQKQQAQQNQQKQQQAQPQKQQPQQQAHPSSPPQQDRSGQDKGKADAHADKGNQGQGKGQEKGSDRDQ